MVDSRECLLNLSWVTLREENETIFMHDIEIDASFQVSVCLERHRRRIRVEIQTVDSLVSAVHQVIREIWYVNKLINSSNLNLITLFPMIIIMAILFLSFSKKERMLLAPLSPAKKT